MPAMPPPVADERQALRDYLLQQQYAYHALAFGLTDEQARATPTVSALSIGGLIKHVTGLPAHVDAARRRRAGSRRRTSAR